MARRAPMTADEARENIAAMKAETPVNAQRRLLWVALDMGNLSADARAVYADRLFEIDNQGD